MLMSSTGQVPGFKVVIVSSLPAKLGLGSDSALVVALYTLLEAITSTCTGNVMEKMLVCQQAKRLATNSCKVRASDILVSLIGDQGRIFAFDAQSLDVDRANWNDTDVQLVLVELNDDTEGGKKSSAQRDESKTRCEQVATAMNTMSRWRAHPAGASSMGLLFPRETMEMVKDAIVRHERIANMTNAIRRERWEEFGRIIVK
ncbi:galactokinase-like [Frieseomelitta varia]|uniref:galactokinase-like n=1 Tax=Frieseomelitta varia TaxID=561572 RepID=UPI001CB68FC9|nr:galactokinase-like [Frieseomelitta varia]